MLEPTPIPSNGHGSEAITITPESTCRNLICLDPPLLPGQIEAFCDLWSLDEESEHAIRMMPGLMCGVYG